VNDTESKYYLRRYTFESRLGLPSKLDYVRNKEDYFRIIRRLVVYHVRITLVQPPLPFQSTHTSSIPRLLGAGPRPMRCSNLLRRFPEGFFSQTYDATVRLLLLNGRSFASSIANKRWESNKAAGNHSLIQLQPIDHGVNRRTVRMPT
jgi:hypothetical protein